MVRNFYRRNFWRQQKFYFRKVPTKKVCFAPRIDVITPKLAHVASGEVGRFLHFFLKKCWFSDFEFFSGKMRKSHMLFLVDMSEFWSYDIDSKCKTHLLGRNFSKIKFLLPSEISTVEISGYEISQNGAEISAISRHRNLKKIKICSKTAKMGPEWPQIGGRVKKKKRF